jgi:hypothetical protein
MEKEYAWERTNEACCALAAATEKNSIAMSGVNTINNYTPLRSEKKM